MRERVRLVDRQAVHVGAQAHGALRGAGAQHADDAGLADAAMHFDAELGELLRDELRRARFLEPELRVRVDVPAPRGHLVVQPGNARIDWHRVSLKVQAY